MASKGVLLVRRMRRSLATAEVNWNWRVGHYVAAYVIRGIVPIGARADHSVTFLADEKVVVGGRSGPLLLLGTGTRADRWQAMRI